MDGSKDVEEEEETKVNTGPQRTSSRRSIAKAESKEKESPSSPQQKEGDKEDGAQKPRRRRNEGSAASTANTGGGGWMSTSSGSNVVNKIAVGIENDDEAKEREVLKNQNREKHLHDDNDEIMLIPDLDEEGGADSDQRIAHAPRNINRRIPTLAELENDIKKTAASGSSPDGDGFNLSVLLGTLVPSSMVLEPDSVWSFESLLREITDELSNIPKTVVSSTTMGIASMDAGALSTGPAGKVGGAAIPFSGTKQPQSSTPGINNINNNGLLSPTVSKNRNDKKKL